MGNKTVGRKFDRQNTDAVITSVDMKQFITFDQGPEDFLNTRIGKY